MHNLSRHEITSHTIMKTYGSAIRRLAIANVLTHALTKKATPQAQRDVKSSVKVKMRNLMTSVSRPVT